MNDVSFRVHCSGFVVAKKVKLDHTFVHVETLDTSTGDFSNFKCWGSDTDDDPPKAGSHAQHGIYGIPNCYRTPLDGYQDTAGVGVYAVNGVCHQSANLFMYQTGLTLYEGKVLGATWSYSAYGAYGNLFNTNKWAPSLGWLLHFYKPCYKKHHSDEKFQTKSKLPPYNTETAEPLFIDLRQFHESLIDNPISNPHDIIMKEWSILLKHLVPELNYEKFEDIHRDYLKEHDSIITSNKHRGKEFANKINDASYKFQKTMSEHMDPIQFKKISGVEPGEFCAIVDPRIAEQEDKKKHSE